MPQMDRGSSGLTSRIDLLKTLLRRQDVRDVRGRHVGCSTPRLDLCRAGLDEVQLSALAANLVWHLG